MKSHPASIATARHSNGPECVFGKCRTEFRKLYYVLRWSNLPDVTRHELCVLQCMMWHIYIYIYRSSLLRLCCVIQNHQGHAISRAKPTCCTGSRKLLGFWYAFAGHVMRFSWNHTHESNTCMTKARNICNSLCCECSHTFKWVTQYEGQSLKACRCSWVKTHKTIAWNANVVFGSLSLFPYTMLVHKSAGSHGKTIALVHWHSL